MLRATIAACLSSKGATEFTAEHAERIGVSKQTHNIDIRIFIIMIFLLVIDLGADRV